MLVSRPALSAIALSYLILGPAAAMAAAQTELTWYGHAAFILKTPGGTVLAIDPWLTNPSAVDRDAVSKLGKVDFILVSHGHSDHVGDTMEIARRSGARLVAGYDLANALVAEGFPAGQAPITLKGNMGGTIQLAEDVSVTIVPAIHSSGIRKEGGTVPYAGSATGFVIHVKGGPNIYHTGDTDVSVEMQLIPERWTIDYMLACIGGHFTMDPVGAARAAQLTRARVIVPMHYGTYPMLKGTPAALQEALRAKGLKTRVMAMRIGETARL
jgi:L-ascorbate metabolism protein UlaG (beta-lactamase superfamily)